MLYVMRHGITDWNEKHKLQGRTDVPLNDKGRQMAEEARERYRDVHFDICYCSTLVRARETAEILLKDRGIPIIPDERLVEMGFGEFEGTENSFSIPDCGVNTIFEHPESYTESIRGTETFEEVIARTGEFLKELALPQHEEGKAVLIIAHGALNSAIINQIKKLPREKYWSYGIRNCELMRLL